MPTLDLEIELYRRGISPVAGVDEAGRGPLAGPVVSAAVILPSDVNAEVNASHSFPDWFESVDDSKKLTPRKREQTYTLIQENAAAVGVGMASSWEIDAKGIVEATRLSMNRAVQSLPVKPSYLLVDYVVTKDFGVPFRTFPHGDSLCYSIAAASIVAKVTRDRLMDDIDAIYPRYGFSHHKGYATEKHLKSLATHGPSPIHRFSFSPLRTAAAQGKVKMVTSSLADAEKPPGSQGRGTGKETPDCQGL